MTKIETVEKYRDEFLRGKSPEYAAKFMAKDLMKQYGSIMTWRRKNRKQQLAEATAKDVIDYLNASRKMIDELPLLTQDDIEQIRAEITSLGLFLDEKSEESRMAEIEELERQKAEISRRLSMLRGDAMEQPTLF